MSAFKTVKLYGKEFEWQRCRVYANERDFDMIESQVYTITVNDADMEVTRDEYEDIKYFGHTPEGLFNILEFNVDQDSDGAVGLERYRLKKDGAMHYYLVWRDWNGHALPDEDAVSYMSLVNEKYQPRSHAPFVPFDIVVCTQTVY